MEEFVQIRQLDIQDLPLYKHLRLELLENEPANFGSSFEEENRFAEQMWINRLTKKDIITIGSFYKEELVGMGLAVLNPRQKLRHVANLNSIYVKKEFRNLGLAKKMIYFGLKHLMDLDVEIVKLSVVTSNVAAIDLYKKIGFYIYGEDKKSIKWNNKYIDQYLMMKQL